MSVKRSPAARVIEFFTTQPIGEAELVFGLVREVVRKRKAPEATVVVRKSRTRKGRVNAKALLDPASVSTTTASHPGEV